ncbi:hypothetical protein VTO58DRAFT_106729 [Aureobasidium pullulans]
MSTLQYFNEKGAGQKHSDACHYSQAVIVGDVVKCAGQGGWDSEGNLDSDDWQGQIDNAFDNVDRVLQAAGLRGWEDVYLIRSYQLDIANHFEYFVEKLKNRIPGHRPIWTALSVPKLAFPPMLVEIEVEAYRKLALIIAAIGAQYRFESRNGLALYKASKAIALEKIRKQDLAGDCHTSPLSPMPPTLADGPDLTSQQQRIDMIRTLVMLIAFSSWDWKSELLRDAFGLQSILARCLREDGMHEDLSASDQNWYDWILIEGARRVKMIAFAYLNVQTVAYNLPPVMLNNEVELQMPCSTAEWDAPDAIEWQLTRARSRHPDLGFQDALHAFLSRTQVSEVQSLLSRLSPLANFILLQALIQRTCLLRQLSITAGAALRKDDLDEMEDALRRWKNVWQRAPGSTLDPQNPDGPLPFTSVAFFTLASVRLHLDLGSYRRLDTRDPAQIATALIGVPALKRGPHLTTALLHVTHALSLPVNMGVQYVSRSQMFFWSCQHSLCGLESAVFLSKWLQTVAETLGKEPLTAHEIIILDWVRALVEETRESVDLEELGVRSTLEISALQPSQLCTIVLRIWARVFGGNTMWAIISQIGSALEQLAERIERENMRLAQ